MSYVLTVRDMRVVIVLCAVCSLKELVFWPLLRQSEPWECSAWVVAIYILTKRYNN